MLSLIHAHTPARMQSPDSHHPPPVCGDHRRRAGASAHPYRCSASATTVFGGNPGHKVVTICPSYTYLFQHSGRFQHLPKQCCGGVHSQPGEHEESRRKSRPEHAGAPAAIRPLSLSTERACAVGGLGRVASRVQAGTSIMHSMGTADR